MRAMLEADHKDLQWAQFPEDLTGALAEAERTPGEDLVKLEHPKEWAYLSADRNLLVFTLKNVRHAARIRKIR